MITRIHKPVTKRRSARAGFTLVEVMVGAFLFIIIALSGTATMIQAFKIMTLARYEDRAGNVIRVLADQFQNSVYRESDSENWKPFFQVSAPTGQGLAWDRMTQTFVYPTSVPGDDPVDDVENLADPANRFANGTDTGMRFHLATIGQNANRAPLATVIRRVRHVNPFDGSTYADGVTPAQPSGGYILRGDFTITFDYQNRTHTQTISVLRNINPTDK